MIPKLACGATAALLLTLLLMPARAAATMAVNCGDAGSNFGLGCGLDELIAGGNFTIRDKQFTNWAFPGDPYEPHWEPEAIRVDLIDDALRPGFTLVDTASTWTVNGPDARMGQIDFLVQVVGNLPRLRAVELFAETGPVDTEVGDFAVFVILSGIGQVDANDPNTVASVPELTITCAAASCANRQLEDSATVDPALALARIFSVIAVSAETGGATTQLKSASYRFVQVPEPGSAALLGLGLSLTVLAVARRGRPQRGSVARIE